MCKNQLVKQCSFAQHRNEYLYKTGLKCAVDFVDFNISMVLDNILPSTLFIILSHCKILSYDLLSAYVSGTTS